MTWAQALAKANAANGGLGYAGYKDWRLPNAMELASIVESCGFGPAINKAVFPAMPAASYFWSASSYVQTPAGAWLVDFGDGLSSVGSKTGNSYARLVRGGQSGESFDLLSIYKLTITTQPSDTANSGAGFAQQPVIQLSDTGNNPVSQAGVVVTATISTGTGSLIGVTTATTDGSGVATFSGLGLSGTVGAYKLRFTATSVTATPESSEITLSAGAATNLTITTQPSDAANSGAAFAQQPVIQLRDANDNAVSQSGVVVTATISTGTGSLVGTTTATTNASGVATFTNLGLSGAAGTYKLTFTATGFTASPESSAVTLSAGSATKLSITTQPSATAASGAAFAQQPAIQLRDANDNAASQAGVVVTATISTGTGSFVGTTTATTNGSGVATFTDLGLSGAAGTYKLTFTATGFTASPESSAVTLSAGSATKLSITTQPSATAASGAAFAQQPAIQLRDGADNAVSQAGVVVTATISTGTGSLVGTTTATTNGSGVATFTNLGLSGTAGTYKLTFTAAGLTATPESSAITLSAGSATKLSITTQPSSTATAGAAFAQQPVVTVQDANGNTVTTDTSTVTLALTTPAGATLNCTGGTGKAAVAGVASFAGCAIDKAGSYTLTAANGSLTAATSNTIVVAALPPVVAAISPSRGPLAGGTSVTITGTDLAGATQVKFGSADAPSFTVNSATQVIAISPAGSGTVDVTVTTPSGTSPTSTNDQFTYLPVPTVIAIAPDNGPAAGGTNVVISGTGFSHVSAVTIGGNPVTSFTVNSATEIAAVTPPGTSGARDVAVTTPGGTGTGNALFTYVGVNRTYSGPTATGTGTATAILGGGGDSCTFTAARFIGSPPGTNPVPPTEPAIGVVFPHGLFDFATRYCTPGSSVTLSITYPQAVPADAQYWKYGPTPTDPTPHWYVLPATVSGNTVTFTIVDGGLGDDDLMANGSIVDQGGIATLVPPAMVPTINTWLLMLLSLSLLLLAGRAVPLTRRFRN